MLTQLVGSYLDLRRSTGFGMGVHEYLLHGFAYLATQRGETHIRTCTAIEWAAQAPSEGQRANRLSMLRVFARFARAEDAVHEVPPERVFLAPRVHIYLHPRAITRAAGACLKASSGWVDPTVDLYNALLFTGRHRPAHFRGVEPPATRRH